MSRFFGNKSNLIRAHHHNKFDEVLSTAQFGHLIVILKTANPSNITTDPGSFYWHSTSSKILPGWSFEKAFDG